MNFFKKTPNKSFILWILLFVGIYVATSMLSLESQERKAINISAFLQLNQTSQLESVKMYQEHLVAKLKDGSVVTVSYPIFYSVRIIDELISKSVDVAFVSPNSSSGFKVIAIIGNILSWLPMILMGWVALSIFRGMNGGGKNDASRGKGVSGGGLFGGSPFQFGKSKARMIQSKDIKISFKDVAGIDEAKKDVMEIVDFLKDPEKYKKIGGVIPKGCLLVGYPGTGKTLLAKAIAAEASVPFFFISGSDFVEMFVGVGASRVRDMFAQAKSSAPCIIFVDEIDAVGRNRGVGMGGGNDEREQTLNQLLVEMDGFEENNGVVVIAATNRPDVLDPALLRPGRFDRQIVISLPDVEGREKILDVHMKKIKALKSVNSRVIARGTPGFSGADLANLVNEAALLAARDGKEIVTMEDFEEAKDKILMGATRTTAMKKEEKELTAYHEGGHALVAVSLPASDPVHKVTIIPRGRALGVVIRLPKSDTFSVTREKMKADIAVGLAGRVAEEMIFGSERVTSGASSDIEQVTKMARSMVVKWGLSHAVGTIDYSSDRQNGYLNKDNTVNYHASEAMLEVIDKEVKKIIDEAYVVAGEILKRRRVDLEKIVAALLEVETLTGDELANLLSSGGDDKKEKIVEKSLNFGRIASGVDNIQSITEGDDKKEKRDE